MYELTNLTINENDLFHAVVMMERYNEVVYNGKMETKNPAYYQVYKKLKRLWYDMITDEEYTLAVRL